MIEPEPPKHVIGQCDRFQEKAVQYRKAVRRFRLVFKKSGPFEAIDIWDPESEMQRSSLILITGQRRINHWNRRMSKLLDRWHRILYHRQESAWTSASPTATSSPPSSQNGSAARCGSSRRQRGR